MIRKEDRWAEILDRLKNGADYGIEKKRTFKKSKLVTILGRKMTVSEASELSGLPSYFFKPYVNKDLPVEEITSFLNKRWMREKMAKLKQGLS